MNYIEKNGYKFDIPSYPEIFKVITYPRIKSNKYKVSNYGTILNIKTEKVMKTYFDKDGYERITLVIDEKHPTKRAINQIRTS